MKNNVSGLRGRSFLGVFGSLGFFSTNVVTELYVFMHSFGYGLRQLLDCLLRESTATLFSVVSLGLDINIRSPRVSLLLLLSPNEILV